MLDHLGCSGSMAKLQYPLQAFSTTEHFYLVRMISSFVAGSAGSTWLIFDSDLARPRWYHASNWLIFDWYLARPRWYHASN